VGEDLAALESDVERIPDLAAFRERYAVDVPDGARLDPRPRAGGGRATVVDGVIFNDELDILEVRIKSLWACVDWFVVVEAPVSLKNTPKPLVFRENAERFAWASSKLVHVVVESLPDKPFKLWENEEFFRDAVGREGLRAVPGGLRDEDLVLYSDTDEIPDAAAVCFIASHEGLPSLTSFMHRWNFAGFMWVHAKAWQGSVGVRYSALRGDFGNRTHLARIAWQHTCPRTGNNVRCGDSWRVGDAQRPAGWHCSWCMPIRSWLVKLRTFAHTMTEDDAEDPGRHREMRKGGFWFDGVPHGRRAGSKEAMVAPPVVLRQRDRYLPLLDESAPWEAGLAGPSHS